MKRRCVMVLAWVLKRLMEDAGVPPLVEGRGLVDNHIPLWGVVFPGVGLGNSYDEGAELCPECGVHAVSEVEEWRGGFLIRRVGRKCHWCGWREPSGSTSSDGEDGRG